MHATVAVQLFAGCDHTVQVGANALAGTVNDHR